MAETSAYAEERRAAIAAMNAIADPIERLVLAARCWTRSTSVLRPGQGSKYELRAPDPTLFSEVFPDQVGGIGGAGSGTGGAGGGSAEGDAAIVPSRDSAAIARWFAARAQEAGIETMKLPKVGLFDRPRRGWRIDTLTSGAGESTTPTAAWVSSDGRLDPPDARFSFKGLCSMASLLRLRADIALPLPR